MKSSYEINVGNISVSNFSSEGFSDRLLGDHCHDKYEITYILSSGKYIVEGSEQKVSSGTLVFIRPMSFHKVFLDINENTEVFTLHFSRDGIGDAVASILDSLVKEGEGYGRFYTAGQLSDGIISTFDRFEMALELGDTERHAYIQALLSEVIVLLSAAEGEKTSHSSEELGARVAKYLNSHIEKNISLDRLARRFFVSKYHLCRAFKSYSGTTVHAYVNQKRIMYAKGLIESGITALGAAERVGFGDYSAFYRAFVKVVGKSPTAE